MLSVQNYNESIDVWSVGCIFGEMLGRKPLFAGNDYIHQLKLITSLIGKPTEQDLWFVTNPRCQCVMCALLCVVVRAVTALEAFLRKARGCRAYRDLGRRSPGDVRQYE